MLGSFAEQLFIFVQLKTPNYQRKYCMRFFITFYLLIISFVSIAQSKLQPGFDAKEYAILFALSRYGSKFADSLNQAEPIPYKLVYRSPEVGLKNQWNFFLREDKVGLISIRGTVSNQTSWLANFYAAMIPATGRLHLTDSTTFNYKFANNPKAAVHVGWAVSLGFMAEDILQKLKSNYANGVKDFYIFGHSQGGAIAFLTTSYLRHLQMEGTLPADIQFKTYSSAGPKPGNTNYAYDYEFITRGGWGFNVVNAADWVPETPFTVQKIQDMNEINPLVHTREMLKKQKALIRLVGNYTYRKFTRKPKKVQKMYTKVFGNTLYDYAIKKALSQYHKPEYYQSSNYARAGSSVILVPDTAYYERFRFDEKKPDYFLHHHFSAYYYLLKKYYLK